MSVALNTNKRKFHQLIDNLTASSPANKRSALGDPHANASSSSLAGRSEPPSKRSRISFGGSASLHAYNLASRLGTSSAKSSVRLIGRHGKEKETTERKQPNYMPWSREQFLARLKTFSDVKVWTSKPDAVSEVEWARRGWSCVGWNTVGCRGGCEQRVSIRLKPGSKDSEGKEIPNTEDPEVEVENEVVQRFAELIVTGHDEGCPWRRSGCRADILHIPIAKRDQCAQDLRRRIHSIAALGENLPPAGSIVIPEPYASLEQLTDLIPPGYLETDGETAADAAPHPDQVALAFAVFGWSGNKVEGLPIATCEDCFQRIGLWMYKRERLKEMSEKIGVDEAHLQLNLLELHREHCPWKNPDTQANPKSGPYANMGAFDTLIKSFERARRPSVNVSPRAPSVVSVAGTEDDTESVVVEETEEEKDRKVDERVKGLRKYMAKIKSLTASSSKPHTINTPAAKGLAKFRRPNTSHSAGNSDQAATTAATQPPSGSTEGRPSTSVERST